MMSLMLITLLLVPIGAQSDCKIPTELDIWSVSTAFKQIPFAISSAEGRIRLECSWIGAKQDSSSSLYIFGGSLMCENGTGKWLTDAGYEAPPFISCLSTEFPLISWPEYGYIFDVQENRSTQMLLIFKGGENYCTLDSELELSDGTKVHTLRYIDKGGHFQLKLYNASVIDLLSPTIQCRKRF